MKENIIKNNDNKSKSGFLKELQSNVKNKEESLKHYNEYINNNKK